MKTELVFSEDCSESLKAALTHCINATEFMYEVTYGNPGTGVVLESHRGKLCWCGVLGLDDMGVPGIIELGTRRKFCLDESKIVYIRCLYTSDFIYESEGYLKNRVVRLEWSYSNTDLAAFPDCLCLKSEANSITITKVMGDLSVEWLCDIQASTLENAETIAKRFVNRSQDWL